MSMVLCEENNCSVAENSCSEQENIRLTREDCGGGGRPSVNMEHDEKRMRRQIANSNERRRMQSINAGFQSLRQLLPHHEGEKLSKAAILQQTAEYIYALEQEKTRLLSQNCQLKRQLDQQDHGLSSSDITTQAIQQTQTTTITATPTTVVGTTVLAATNNNTGNIITVAKKRKIDAIMPAISDSSDEGLGSMSPEPISLLTVLPSANPTNRTITGSVSTMTITAKDYLDMKHQLDTERRQKALYEERIRSLERQLYPTRVPYDHQEIVDHTENVEEVAVSIIQKTATPTITTKLQSRPEIIEQHHHHHHHKQQPQQQQQVQVIHIDGKQQVVLCSATEIIDNTQEITNINEDNKVVIKRSRSKSPIVEKTVTVQLPPKKCRIPSLLEAAIKAEPKVEVERIASPASTITAKEQQSRSYMTNTCRQNLETIVEAIKHLEGDVFSDSPSSHGQNVVQEAPLALTNKQQIIQKDHRQLQMDIQPFLKFRNAAPPAQPTSIIAVSIGSNPQSSISCHSPHNHQTSQQQQASVAASQLLQQQCRPGVIVVKQNS